MAEMTKFLFDSDSLSLFAVVCVVFSPYTLFVVVVFVVAVSLTGAWRVPLFIMVVILLIVGSQEKAPVPGKGEDRRKDRSLVDMNI